MRRAKGLDIKKIIICVVAIILLITIIGLIWYVASISKVSRKDDEIEVTIPLGSGTNKIAKILKENKLIKSKMAFKLYVRLNKVTNFQAGKYYLKQNMNVKEITQMLQTGIMHDPNQLSITYIEGKNMRWLAKKIEETTNNSQEAVMQVLSDENYINSLIDKYWFLTDEVKQEEIFEKMLDKMEDVLEEYKSEIEKSKYSVHQILTIASIIETESMNSEGRKDVSSVIYNRLNRGMAIQSDVTTYYAVKVDMGERDLYQKELDTYNAYNTRGPNMEGKLPIGPVASVSKSSIEAALEPNNTDYIFFVADKNGKLYFTKTASEHNRVISELKEEGLWFEY